MGELLRAVTLSAYRSFAMLGIPMNGEARAFTWDGDSLQELANAEQLQPFTSSSCLTAEVIARRCELFRQSRLRGEAFHSSHLGGPGPHSICMHRPDAET